MPPLRKALFNDIHWIRINDAFPEEQNRTSFTESNPKTLAKIYEFGRQSFGEREAKIKVFFGLHDAPIHHTPKAAPTPNDLAP